MYKLLLVAIVLFINGCTSCTKEETQKEVKDEVVKSSYDQKEQKTVQLTPGNKKDATEPRATATKEEIAQKIKLDTSINDPKQGEVEAIDTLYPQIIKETKAITTCLEQAETKEDALNCSKNLSKLNDELSKSIGDFMSFEVKGFIDRLEWDQESKAKAIQYSKDIIKEAENLQKCISEAKDAKSKKSCLELQF